MKLLSAFALLILFQTGMSAQNSGALLKKINSLYKDALTLSEQGNTAQSVQLLQQILKMDSTWHMAYFALSDLYHEMKKPDEEINSLQKGLTFAGDSYPVGFKFLAQELYKKGDYAEAKRNIDHYAGLKITLTPPEKLLLESCSFSVEAVNHPVAFHPLDPGDSINTVAEEYWPSLNAEANKLVFTRQETKDTKGRIIQHPQEDFYYSVLGHNGWCKSKPLGAPINTEENEGAQTLSADGRLLIFTGCGRADGIGSCDLYISVNQNGVWTVPINMGEPVNSGAWESQPALSADGETLFFVSSRRGGKGNMDLWKAVKTAVLPDGVPEFGNVTNVSELNTIGNDLSPFVHADGKTLYFASNGRPGLGNNDLYMTRLKNDKWSEPVNLGYPINTLGNEEGLTVEISGERAWFSTNRNPLKGRDIYYFTLPDSLRPEPVSYLRGVVVDALTGLKLKSDIVLSNLKTNRVIRKILFSENEGDFLVCLPSGNNYGLNITRKGYLFASENVSLVDGYTKSRPQEVTIRLQPITTGASTTLKNIFFETNSWQLKDESRTQLDEVSQFMQQNPGVVVEVIGHTDHIGTKEYNLELSGKRAEAVITELKKRNIAPWRLKSKGAGFAFPVGDNETEEGRSSNRRTEFLITEVKSEK